MHVNGISHTDESIVILIELHWILLNLIGKMPSSGEWQEIIFRRQIINLAPNLHACFNVFPQAFKKKSHHLKIIWNARG